jgi:hypothetical protein
MNYSCLIMSAVGLSLAIQEARVCAVPMLSKGAPESIAFNGVNASSVRASISLRIPSDGGSGCDGAAAISCGSAVPPAADAIGFAYECHSPSTRAGLPAPDAVLPLHVKNPFLSPASNLGDERDP